LPVGACFAGTHGQVTGGLGCLRIYLSIVISANDRVDLVLTNALKLVLQGHVVNQGVFQIVSVLRASVG